MDGQTTIAEQAMSGGYQTVTFTVLVSQNIKVVARIVVRSVSTSEDAITLFIETVPAT